jgi:hypothetical protein
LEDTVTTILQLSHDQLTDFIIVKISTDFRISNNYAKLFIFSVESILLTYSFHIRSSVTPDYYSNLLISEVENDQFTQALQASAFQMGAVALQSASSSSVKVTSSLSTGNNNEDSVDHSSSGLSTIYEIIVIIVAVIIFVGSTIFIGCCYFARFPTVVKTLMSPHSVSSMGADSRIHPLSAWEVFQPAGTELSSACEASPFEVQIEVPSHHNQQTNNYGVTTVAVEIIPVAGLVQDQEKPPTAPPEIPACPQLPIPLHRH